jgi:hypothetical protein
MLQTIPIDRRSGAFRYHAPSFEDAGQNSFDRAPGQHPSNFELLQNVMPPVRGALERRWGRSVFSQVGLGGVDRVYEYQAETDPTPRLIMQFRAVDGVYRWVQNELTNGNFERGVLGWNFDNVATNLRFDAGKAYQGTRYAELTAASTSRVTLTQSTVRVIPAEIATVSARFCLDAGTAGAGTFGIVLQLLDADFNVVATSEEILNTASAVVGTWIKLSGQIEVPITAVHADFQVFIAANHAGVTLRVDNAFLGIGPVEDQGEELSLLFQASAGSGPLYVAMSQGVAYMCNGTEAKKWAAEPIRNTYFDPAEDIGLPAPSTAPVVTAVTEAAEADYTLRPIVYKNGWGSNQHVGDFEQGVNQGHSHPPALYVSTVNPYTNPTSVFDGSESTAAKAEYQHTHQYAGCVWKFQSTQTSVDGAMLRVLSSVEGTLITGRTAGVWYTFNGGTEWTLLYESTPDVKRAKQWDEILVPDGTNPNNIRVMAFLDSHDNMSHQVYDIRIDLAESINPNAGRVDLDVGRRYFVCFKDAVTGHYSDLSPVSESTGPATNSSFTISLPVVPVSHPYITTKAILATADGYDMQILYELAEVDAAITTYIDNTAELDLLAKNVMLEVDEAGIEHGVAGNQPPPSDGTLIGYHAGRLAMVAKGRHTMRFSKNLSEITTSTGKICGIHQEAWPLDYELEVAVGAERINGWISDGTNIWIGTDRHIRRIAGTDIDNFQQPELAFNNVGVLNQATWQVVYLEGTPMGSMWLTPDFRVIGSDFNMYQNIGAPIQDVLNTINREYAKNAFAITFSSDAYNLYVLAIPTGTNQYCDKLCVLDLKNKRWFVWNMPSEEGIHAFSEVVQFGPAGFYQVPADWDVTANVAVQHLDANPSMVLSNEILDGADEAIVTGTFRIDWPQDDDHINDYIGFAIHYQDPTHFYLFDWRLGNQNGVPGDYPDLNPFDEAVPGMRVLKVDASSALTYRDLWSAAGNPGRATVLYSNSIPWVRYTDYSWRLELLPAGFRIVIQQGTTIVATIAISDSTWTSGKFGLYNYSVPECRYTGFVAQQEVLKTLVSWHDAHGVPKLLCGMGDGWLYHFDPTNFTDLEYNIPVVIRTVWLDMGQPHVRKLLNDLELMTGDTGLTVTVEGASTTAEFASPSVILQDAPIYSSPFGEFKVRLATRQARDRFYRLTFKSLTGSVQTVLDSYSLEVVPFHTL